MTEQITETLQAPQTVLIEDECSILEQAVKATKQTERSHAESFN